MDYGRYVLKPGVENTTIVAGYTFLGIQLSNNLSAMMRPFPSPFIPHILPLNLSHNLININDLVPLSPHPPDRRLAPIKEMVT